MIWARIFQSGLAGISGFAGIISARSILSRSLSYTTCMHKSYIRFSL